MSPDIFRLARAEEVPQVFELVLDRIRWMDETGIRQWNVTDYANVYPLAYYQAHQAAGELFVLEREGCILCSAVLLSADSRWPADHASAFYLHNFASRRACKGVGAAFIAHAEAYAAAQGKTYFRLDSADDNPALTRYYDALGYQPVGHCVDGLYRGILRQKQLHEA